MIFECVQKLKGYNQLQTKILFFDTKDFDDKLNTINLILREKHAFLTGTDDGEILAKYLNERFKLPVHLSRQKLFHAKLSYTYRKSLDQSIINRINSL